MSTVKMISITPQASAVMAFCARVSNPKNQLNPDVSGLLSYCARKGHWSVFEQANMTLEVRTSRAIAAQILRHRSFSFQEFSQRYSEVEEYFFFKARKQDQKNRQNSHEDSSHEDQEWFEKSQRELWDRSYDLYQKALHRGIARECARALLPMNTATTLYMNGTVRSWIHYIQVRTEMSTQKEHRDIAQQCREIFQAQLPEVAKALGWVQDKASLPSSESTILS